VRRGPVPAGEIVSPDVNLNEPSSAFLVREVTLDAAIALDTINQTITLPLYRGTGPRGERVFFILTESSDFGQAVKLGINWSPKLVNALGTSAVQRVRGVTHSAASSIE